MSKSRFNKYEKAKKMMENAKKGMNNEIISYLNNRNVFDLRGLKYAIQNLYDHNFKISDFKSGKVNIQKSADKLSKQKNQKNQKKYTKNSNDNKAINSPHVHLDTSYNTGNKK